MTDLNRMPEDSTLRRHYETHQRMLGESGGGAPSGHAPRSGDVPRPAPAESSHRHAASGSSSGGVMGWLKKMFG